MGLYFGLGGRGGLEPACPGLLSLSCFFGFYFFFISLYFTTDPTQPGALQHVIHLTSLSLCVFKVVL